MTFDCSGNASCRGLLRGRAAYDLRSGLGYRAPDAEERGRSTRAVLRLPAGSLLRAPYPAPAGLLPAGKAWISVPVVAGDPLAAQVEGLSPELALSEVAWGGEHASTSARAWSGHLPLDGYRVTVDLQQALARAKRAGRPASRRRSQSELQTSGANAVPVTVWVNGPGYVAQLEKSAPGTGLGTTSYSFSGFAPKFNRTGPTRRSSFRSSRSPIRSARSGRVHRAREVQLVAVSSCP